jgi:hypothetical protein
MEGKAQMKKIISVRLSTPDAPGYPDRIKVLDMDCGDMELWSRDRFGTNPNPTKPDTFLHWLTCYAQIVAQTYEWQAIVTDGKPYLHLRLFFNGLEKIPTTNMNFNHDGLFYAEKVNIERGWSDKWRGSKACQVVHPDDYSSFISLFTRGERGFYELVDNLQS